MSAGLYIRKKRMEKGMSQRQLAALSGISNSEISRIEAGERRSPSPQVLNGIARALDLPYETLLSEAGYLPSEGPGAVSGEGRTPIHTQDSPRHPEWVYALPPDLYEFVREESSRGWPYVRLAKGLSRKDLDPAELEAIVRTWIEAKKRYGKDPRPR